MQIYKGLKLQLTVTKVTNYISFVTIKFMLVPKVNRNKFTLSMKTNLFSDKLIKIYNQLFPLCNLFVYKYCLSFLKFLISLVKCTIFEQ